MTAVAPDADRPAGVPHCGCCDRTLPSRRLTELGATPGVFICASCALWAARRATWFPVVRLDPRLAVRWVARRVSRDTGSATMAVPILPSSDLDRTAGYYRSLGLKVTDRADTYLVMNLGPVEMHFTSGSPAPGPGQAFVHVSDAARLWKRLKAAGTDGLGPVEDRASGMREFVVTDPDSNHIRVGSPAPKD